MRNTEKSKLLYLVLSVLLTFSISGIVEAYEGSVAVFPFVISDSRNTTTLISIMVPNPDGSNDNTNCLHFRYFVKDKNAPLTDSCLETDFWVETSPNDLMTFDVRGLIGGGKALYGDTDSIGYPGCAGCLSDFITYGINSFIGYLTVETLATVGPSGQCLYGGATPVQGVPPDGEAVIHDLALGTSWAYRAYSQGRHHYEQAILLNGFAAPTSWLPPNFAKTEFIVTPVDLDGNAAQQKSAVVQLVLDKFGDGGLFDRNEIPYSQFVEQEVKCVGVVNINNLLSSSIATNPVLRSQGGWGYLLNRNTAAQNLANDAWVYKVETYTRYSIKNSLPFPPICAKFPGICTILLEPIVNAVPNGGYSIIVNPNITPK